MDLFVMLMTSYSHRLTFGHIGFHLPIGFPLSLAASFFRIILRILFTLESMYDTQLQVKCLNAKGHIDTITS